MPPPDQDLGSGGDGPAGPGADAGPYITGTVWEVTATASAGSCNSYGHSFLLLLAPGSGPIKGVVSAGGDEAPTNAVSGTLTGGKLSLDPYSLHRVTGQAVQGTISFQVSSFKGLIATDGRLSGTLAGTRRWGEYDMIKSCMFTGTFTGTPDVEAPRTRYLGAKVAHVLDQPGLSFSEPVRMKASGTAATMTVAGKTAATLPFAPGYDPAGAIDRMQFKLPGHLPFGATVTLAASAKLQDLAGSPITPPLSATFTTMTDPGPLTNGGFEAGDLRGFHPASSYFISVQKSAHGLKPPQGSHFAVWRDHDVRCGRLTARLDLPAGAKQVLITLNHLAKSSSGTLPYTRLIISSPTALKAVALSNALPPAKLKLNDGQYSHHSGFTDVALDVTGLAGQSVALTVDNREYSKYFTGQQATAALILDDIRVK